MEDGYAQFALGEDSGPLPWGELTISAIGLENRVERFDLKLMAAEVEDGIALSFQYRRDLFEQATITRFAEYFDFVLGAVLKNPDKAIGALAMETESAKYSTVEVRTKGDADAKDYLPIQARIAHWAMKTPQAVAVVAGRDKTSYAELDAKANRLAWLLRHEGVDRDIPVGLCATRSAETIVAMLAILKAGGAYLPFDPELPPLRIARMLADAGARAVVCGKAWLERLELDFSGAIIPVDGAVGRGDLFDEDPRIGVAPEDLAYVIFTSGSSGTPKGVAVANRSLWNYTEAMLGRLGDEPGMRFALASTLAADLGHTVVFPSLVSGGCLHLLTEDEVTDPRAFEDFLVTNEIDILKITPSHYNALLSPIGDRTPTPHKALIFGGEELPMSLAKRVAASGAGCELFNHYGPTETTVGALVFPLKSEELKLSSVTSAPIGRPIENMNVLILDQDCMPTPYGVSGEICLSGAGVARGYIHQPDLTAERFLPNPFGAPGERLYRTGDLGVFDGRGDVTFLGRIDQQIKLRGYRIELSEIEARLRAHPSISQAAVVPIRSGSQTRLAAYVVGRGDGSPTTDALRAYLAATLPDYMIPAFIVSLEALPVTTNGKIDQRRLPAPSDAASLSNVYRPPRNEVEERLARIYAEILEIERIGVDDNFFSLGGDSIASIRVASRAYAEGFAITARQIFRHQTIAALAEAIGAPKVRPTGVQPESCEETGSAPSSYLTQVQLEDLGVAASEIEDIYPVTPLQAGLLFHTLSEPNSGVYVMQHRYWIEGDIDIDSFRHAWQAIADAHPIFRTSFVWEGLETPLQLVWRHIELPFSYADWRSFSEAERDKRLNSLLAEERAKGFELGSAPLIRIRLFRIDNRQYLLIRSHHHILFDAWCTSLILEELRSNYDALVAERAPAERIHVGFRDYIAWLQRRDSAGAEPFWRDYLRGFDEPTPFFPGRSSVLASKGVEDVTLLLSREETDALEQIARRLHVTVNTFAQAALALLLARYTNRKEILLGVTVSGRPADLPHVESILGLFINALPLRVAIEADQSLTTLLENVLASNYAIRDYEYISLTKIHEWSEIPAGTEMFHYLLTFENAPVDQWLMEPHGDWRFTSCWHRTHTNYPITFVVIPGPRLHLQVTYARDRVGAEVAEQLLDHYRRLLVDMIRRPNARLGEFEMLAEDERRLLTEQWNQTEYHYAEPCDIVGRFEEQVKLRPDAIAACCDGATLSYRELALRARVVAAGLIREGVEADELVALLDYRGLDFLVMMLGVFYAGAGYLPLDPAYPDGRIAQILVEAKVPRMLTGRSFIPRAESIISGVGLNSIRMLNIAALEGHGEPYVERRHRPTGLAFVIFTSGSTGKPKGAAVEHQGMFNNLITKERALGLTCDDVIAQTASQCFDISVWQFLTALALGARVEILPDDISRDPERLLDEIDTRGVTILETVPSMIRALLDASDIHRRLHSLRWLLPCGEAFAPELCRLFMERFPHVRLLNAYGPAECSDDVSYFPIDIPPEGDDLSVPIGSPVDNTRLYIVNKWLEPASVGVSGEICVAGIQVGRGYLNRPDLTAASFLPDPFEQSGGRLYRTGDLGRRRDDGVIEFLGRIDHQVKIRGNRIEPGEIEARLVSHPDVRGACVIIQEVSKGARRLIAYVASPADRFFSEELRRHIRSTLPDYMVPEAFIRLDALPLSPNGKVDRKALPTPELELSISSRRVAPRNPTEETIAQIWMDLLGAPDVGVNDNFFDLGGHSLLAARVASRIRSIFAIELPLRELLEASDISDLAARVDEARGRPSASSSAPIVRASRDAAMPLSNAQQRLWFMQQWNPSTSAYNLKLAVRASGPLDDDLFEKALNAIVQRHETLRTVFVVEDGRVTQKILPELAVKVHCEIVNSTIDNKGELGRAMTDFAVAPFDLKCGPLVRCAIYRLKADGDLPPTAIVLLCFHHIIFDGWSFAVFLQEFAVIYSAMHAGREAQLPPLPIQYADYATWDAGQLYEQAAEEQISYWKEQLWGAPYRLGLPTDRLRNSVADHGAGSRAVELYDLQQSFDAFNRERVVTPFMTILSAFAVLLRYLSGSSDLVVGADVANRPRVELESLVGCFVNQVALRLRLDGDPSFQDIVERARTITMSAYDYQAFPFDKLVEVLRPERSAGYSPIFQAKVAFHNFPMPEFDIAELQFEQMDLGSSHAELDLVLHVYQRPQGMRVAFEYQASLFDSTTIDRYLMLFYALLRTSLERPDTSLGALLGVISKRDKAIRDTVRSERLAVRRERLHHVARRNVLS
ncbi:MAG: amino acid adenylation domain-containing protein [Methylocystis sp.]